MKRHLLSALVTFITAFSIYFATVIDTIMLETLTSGAWVSIVFVAIRAGFKSLLEYIIVTNGVK